MNKGISFTFFLFSTLVAFNWLFFAALHALTVPFASRPANAAAPSAAAPSERARAGIELASIDFSLFSKNGTGRSYITQGYGRTSESYRYPNGWHNGIDIAAAYDAPIYAPEAGFVIAVGNQDDYCPRRGFGKYVALKDEKRSVVTWYAHLGTVNVNVGERVPKGHIIAAVGATGLETGTHLHFSTFEADGFRMDVRDGCGPEPTGRDRNPLTYLESVYHEK